MVFPFKVTLTIQTLPQNQFDVIEVLNDINSDKVLKDTLRTVGMVDGYGTYDKHGNSTGVVFIFMDKFLMIIKSNEGTFSFRFISNDGRITKSMNEITEDDLNEKLLVFIK